MNHFAQDQAQPHGAGGNVWLGPSVGKTARQQGQIEAFLGIRLELAQLSEIRAIHRRGLRLGARVRR